MIGERGEKNKGYTEVRKCIVCGNEYLVKLKKSSGKKAGNIRHKNSKTCSKICSSKYIRHRKQWQKFQQGH